MKMTMSLCRRVRAMTCVVVLSALAQLCSVRAQTPEEFKQLKAMVEQMQKTIEAQNARIAELEKLKAATPAAPSPGQAALETNSPSIQTVQKIAAGQKVAEQSPITYRGALNDQQEP